MKQIKPELKELPLKYNRWGEPRCPGCDMELYYAWVPEIEKGKKLVHEECNTIILPSKI